MNIGVLMHTHGLLTHLAGDYFLQPIAAAEMRPVAIAQQAERLGCHSVMFGDHITMPQAAAQPMPGNPSGRSAYPSRPNMLDAAVVMGAVAASTTRIKIGSSVLIAPYRHPLIDARQLATLDVLSNGRLIVGVGAGWLREEFEALGRPFDVRGEMAEECIQVYRRAWCDDRVAYQGRFYRFDNLSMDPKPVQRPGPPIVFGAVSKTGARRAARLCDGFYPEMADATTDPARFTPLQDEIRREAARLQRDLSRFTLITCISAHITAAPIPAQPRPIGADSAEQLHTDLERLAAEGYALVLCFFSCPSGTVAELQEQIERFGQEVLPEARKIQATGEWNKDL